MSEFKQGDRVRMVHQSASMGTVVGPLEKSPKDGGPRLPVKWDRTGKINSWSPAFLRPALSDPAADPDEIKEGGYVMRRERILVKPDGVSILIPGGLFFEEQPK